MSQSKGAADPKLASLSLAAQEAVKSNLISGAYNVNALTELLSELEKWDLSVEENRARVKKLYIGSWVATFIGFVLFIIVTAVAESFFIGLLLFLIPFACIFVFKRALKEAKSKDLANEARTIIRPMLQQLRHDLHQQAKIKTTINLAVMNEAQGAKSTLPPQGTDKKRELTVFEHDLCDVRMPLADGSTAVLRVNNTFHKLDRTYRASSGKTKSKTKWKKLSTATVMLIPSQPVTWQPAQVQRFMDDTCEKLSFAESNGVSVPRLDRHYKFKKEMEPPEDSVPVEDVVALFVRLVAMQPVVAGGAQ